MYISIERNSKGNLEIDDNVINQQVEYIVANKAAGIKNIDVNVGIHNENDIFILVKLTMADRKSFEHNYDLKALTTQIEETIQNTMSYKPKSVSFAYVH
jgi:hypothetical protein